MKNVLGALVAIAAMCPLTLRADPFEGVGRAPISGGDRVRARDRALDDAFQHAIEAAVSSLLGADTLTKKAAELRLKIMPRARSYVRSYRILDEGESEPGYFGVHVSADVQAERLVRELATSPAPSKAAPRASVRVAICARAGGQVVPLPRFEQALKARLEAGGATVSDAGCEAKDARLVTAELDAGDVTPIRGTLFVGRECKLTLRLDGPRAVEGHGQSAGYGATPSVALDDAALAALSDAASDIDEALGGAAHAEPGVVVRVAGVRKLGQLALVRTALERLPGVETVELRRFAAGNGPIEVAVKTSQPAHALFESLQRVAATYRLRAREADDGLVIDVPDASDPMGAP